MLDARKKVFFKDVEIGDVFYFNKLKYRKVNLFVEEASKLRKNALLVGDTSGIWFAFFDNEEIVEVY